MLDFSPLVPVSVQKATFQLIQVSLTCAWVSCTLVVQAGLAHVHELVTEAHLVKRWLAQTEALGHAQSTRPSSCNPQGPHNFPLCIRTPPAPDKSVESAVTTVLHHALAVQVEDLISDLLHADIESGELAHVLGVLAEVGELCCWLIQLLKQLKGFLLTG